MATLGEIANIGSTRGGLSAHAVSRGLRGAPISMTITIQGARAVEQHFAAVALATRVMAPFFVGLFGGLLQETAKAIHEPHRDSGDTYNSITAGQVPGQSPHVFLADGGPAVDVGPNTLYAPFQEFGFIHWQTGNFIINPFMVPAADAVAPLFFDAFIQMAEIAANRTTFTGQASTGNALFGQFRGFLYSYSKFLGDVQVFGSFGPGIARSRGVALKSARILGDVDAGMRGAIGRRFTHRFVGRFAAQGISTSISASLTGPSASYIGSSSRLYNRIRGRAFGRGLGLGGF